MRKRWHLPKLIDFKIRKSGRQMFLIAVLGSLLMDPGNAVAQSGIPSGECGIEYVYDAAGNMVERHYICNNSPSPLMKTMTMADQQHAFQATSTLYPNPTSGRFNIRVITPLQNAKVEIFNASGAIILRTNMSGSLLEFNLSGKPSGVYFILIHDNAKILSARVIIQ